MLYKEVMVPQDNHKNERKGKTRDVTGSMINKEVQGAVQ